jgi:hypothetical protein
MVSCYVKRRLPPDLFPDDLNCLLNTCDYSVTVVGDERLPPASINRLSASLVSSHISWPFVSYSPTFLFSSNQPWARTRRVEVRRTTLATSGSASQVPPRRTLVTPSTRRRSFPLSLRGRRSTPLPRCHPMTRTIPKGSLPRCGRTSRPSSAPGSRARMSRRSPRTRRTPPTRPRRRAAVTATTRATAAMEVTAAMMATATARATEAAAARATATVARATATARAAVAAARPVAKRHWFKY